MASQAEIINRALTILGETARVVSIDDNSKIAREAKAVYSTSLRSLLAKHNWTFAKDRALIPALSAAPLFEYAYQYPIPTGALRILMVGEHYVGIDMTDYRGSPVEEYAIENGNILTNMGSPLRIKYIKEIADPGLFSAAFTSCFAAMLAVDLAEALTQSTGKQEIAMTKFRDELRDAVRCNAIEQPPVKVADDEWLISRL